MSVNAGRIITDAFRDLGVIGANETPTADLAQDGLRRLNTLVLSWSIQSLTVPAIQRTVLPLVANQQTYTIGPGGDFDMPRPVSLAGAGLLLNGFDSPLSATITASGTVATATVTAHGLSVGDEVLIDGANEVNYNGLQTVQTVPTVDTFTYALEDLTTSPATGTIVAYPEGDQPVEIPRGILTDDGYEAIPIKTLTNSLFTNVYYNKTAFPFGIIYLWPRPNTASNQLVLYLPQVFAQFADLTTGYDWPATPGYQDALEYNLAIRLARPYAVPVQSMPDIVMMARETLMLLKRANYKLTDLPVDYALVLSHRRSGYNINSGTGGSN